VYYFPYYPMIFGNGVNIVKWLHVYLFFLLTYWTRTPDFLRSVLPAFARLVDNSWHCFDGVSTAVTLLQFY